MTKKEKLKLCQGCREDYYNSRGGCWHLKSAYKVVRTRVGIWQDPPYTWEPINTLSCHTPDNGTIWIKKDDVRIKA